MKKFALLVALLVGMATAVDAAPRLRVGGGLILDGTVWGGTANVDIPLGEDSPIGINAFVDFHRKSGANTIPAGANITFSPQTEGSAKFSIGAGGGIAKFTGTTALLLDGTAIVDIPLNESLNLFGQARYLWSKKSGVTLLNDFGVHVGVSFSLGE